MREIKFRGRCIKSNDFVYGDLIHGVGPKGGNIYILPNKLNLAYVKHCDPLDGVQVKPESVGQFTSLKDKNGKEIYEGDMVRYKFKGTIIFKRKVKFKEGGFKLGKYGKCIGEYHARDLEVVGNIFRNPEILNP